MTHNFVKLQQVLLAACVVLGYSLSAQAGIVDTFDEQTQSISHGGCCGADVSGGNVSTFGGPRQLISEAGTVSVNVTPGVLDIAASRGDVRIGAGDAGQAALNLDWSAFPGYEIDVLSTDFTTANLQVGLFTNNGATAFGNQNFAVTTGTLVIPFSSFTAFGPAPTALDLQDVDGAYIRFIGISGGTKSIVATEWRVGSATVPEPSSFVLAGLGLVGLAGWGIRRRKV